MTEPWTQHLAPLPVTYDFEEVVALCTTHFPETVSVARVTVADVKHAAVYLPDPQPSAQQLADWQAAVAAHVPSGTPKSWQNEAAIRDAATQALATLRNVRNQAGALKGATFANNTQRDNAIRDCALGIELVAENLIRLGRLTLGQLDGTT